MNNNSLKVVLGLLVAAAAVIGAFYLFRTSKVQEPAVISPTPTSTPVLVSEGNMVSVIQSEWQPISASLTAALGFGPVNGRWFLDGVQVISSNRAFIVFEDGHNAHIAFIEYSNGSFAVKETFKSRTSLPSADWNGIVNQYGADIFNYSVNGAGDLVRVEENIILASTAPAMKVKIALLAGGAKDGDGERLQGCDLVVFRDISVPGTTMPLTAAMKELFVKRDPWPYTESANGNFITSQNLTFDRAVMEGSTARIYIKGSYVLGGVCDDPRIEVQIRNTALQFPTVKNVEIYLNGNRFVTPSER